MFGSGGLLAADTAFCEVPGLGKQVHYPVSSWVKEGSSSMSGEGWSENGFLFVAIKSLFQAWADLASCQRLLGTATFFKRLFFILFLLNPHNSNERVHHTLQISRIGASP